MVADDPSIRPAVVEDGGDHGGGAPTALVVGHQGVHERRVHQRGVAAHHNDCGHRRVEHLETDARGATGAVAHFLQAGAHARGQRGLHLVALGAQHHDHRCGVDAAQRVEGPEDHGPAGQRVQHLGEPGPHAGSMTRGKDDCADAHLAGLTWLPGWGGRIRTPDRGTKTRCLTTWLRPSAPPGTARRTIPAWPGVPVAGVAYRSGRVMAPSLADDTSAAYLASTPVV